MINLDDFKKTVKTKLVNEYGFKQKEININYDRRYSSITIKVPASSIVLNKLYNEIKVIANQKDDDRDVYRDSFNSSTDIVDKNGSFIDYIFVENKNI